MVQTDNLRAEFSQRLAQALKDAGYPEHGRGMRLAKALGVTSKAVSKWLSGESLPRPAMMEQIARLLRVDVVWLQHGKQAGMNSNVTSPQPFSRGNSYPLLSWVSAGAWCEAIEPYTLNEILERYESNAHVEGDAFWLRVKGDSMTSPYGQSIAEGMMILVDTGREPKNGSLVVAKLTDANEATFKKLVIDSGLGKKYLQPLNPHQERIEVNGNCKIIGVAIEQRGSLI